jgi:hypothetical protein
VDLRGNAQDRARLPGVVTPNEQRFPHGTIVKERDTVFVRGRKIVLAHPQYTPTQGVPFDLVGRGIAQTHEFFQHCRTRSNGSAYAAPDQSVAVNLDRRGTPKPIRLKPSAQVYPL